MSEMVEHSMAATSLRHCVAKSAPYRMKVCPVKGKGADTRIAYSSRMLAPKSCFRLIVARTDQSTYQWLEANVQAKACNRMMGYSQKVQNRIQTVVTRERVSTEPVEEGAEKNREPVEVKENAAEGDRVDAEEDKQDEALATL